MSESTNGAESSSAKKSHKKLFVSILKVASVTAAFIAVFWFGVSIGNGSLVASFNSPVSDNKGLPKRLNYTEVDRLYDVLRNNFDGKLSEEKLMDGLKKGLVDASGDQHTVYFNEKESKEFQEQLTGTFSGIGAELGKNEDGNLIIVSPIKGFPAEKIGIKAQDVIVSINGENTSGLAVDKAVSKIRGEKGTKVTLEIYRQDEGTKTYKITRDTIIIPSVEWKVLDNNVGYIQISQFWTDTPQLVSDAAKEFKEKGVTSVVLDLRGNPGGSLDAAVDVSSVWLPSGKIALEQKRDGKTEQTYYSTGTAELLGMPTRVLIDKGSASASEIVAGALRDNNVAKLVGEKSYGKGSVQDIIPLAAGGEIKVTIARWYRPNGQNIDKKGIKPDTVIAITKEDVAAGKDPQLDAAILELQK